MKNIYFKIGLAALALIAMAGCEASDNNTESAASVGGSEVEISVTNVRDYSFDVTVSPKDEASYYAYAVIASDEAQDLDPSTLYADGYKSVAASSGVFKYSSEVPMKKVSVSKLASNTTYWIYAVAGGKTGDLGTVATASVKTTDTGIPQPLEMSIEGGTVTLTYSEPVTLSKSAGNISLNCYAWKSLPFIYYLNGIAGYETPSAASSLTVPASAIKVSGETVTFDVEGLIAGSLVSPVIPEGEFLDAVNNPSEAVSGAAPEALYALAPTKPFSLGAAQADTVRNLADMIPIDLAGNEIGYTVSGGELYLDYHEDLDNFGTLTFKSTRGPRASSETHDIASIAQVGEHYYIKNFGVQNKTPFVQFFDERPAPGDSVIFTLNEGAFKDIYGNPSAAWTGRFVYDVRVEDFYGTYMVTGFDKAINAADTAYIVLDCNRKNPGYNGTEGYGTSDKDEYAYLYDYKSYKYYDDTSKPRNIRFLYWLGTRTGRSSNELKGYLDLDKGTLSFPDIQQQTTVFYPDDESTIFMFMNYTQWQEFFNRDATIKFDLSLGGFSEDRVFGFKNPSRDMMLVEGWSGRNIMYWFSANDENQPLYVQKINDSVTYMNDSVLNKNVEY